MIRIVPFGLPLVALAVAACTLLPVPEPADSLTVPQQVDGLPVITVAAAMSARDAGVAGPFAVVGWYSEAPMHSCPAPFREVNPLELYCHQGDWALSDRREAAVTVKVTRAGDMTSIEVRGNNLVGPWLQPVYEGADSLAGPGEPWKPSLVVVVGHFRDPSAVTCPLEIRQACMDRFVIDKLAWRP